MDQEARDQIEKIIDEQIDCSQKVVLKQIDALHSKNVETGSIQSGVLVRNALALFEEQGSHFIASLASEVSQASKARETFFIIVECFDQFLLFLEGELKRIIEATGATLENRAASDRHEVAIGNLWQEIRDNLALELETHRSEFVAQQVTLRAVDAVPSANPNEVHGLAPFWHQMWADIAIQILSGELRPREEADIGRAMKEWFVDNEIEDCDMEALECAHRLWLNYRALYEQVVAGQAKKGNNWPGFALLSQRAL